MLLFWMVLQCLLISHAELAWLHRIMYFEITLLLKFVVVLFTYSGNRCIMVDAYLKIAAFCSSVLEKSSQMCDVCPYFNMKKQCLCIWYGDDRSIVLALFIGTFSIFFVVPFNVVSCTIKSKKSE